MEKKNIKMKIVSQRYDVEDAIFSRLLADSADIDPDEFFGEEDILSDDSQKIELSTEGLMIIDGNKVELVYEESEITGMEGSRTSVYFDIDNQGFVSMLRSGAVSTSLVFEKGKRHHCVYKTPIMPFEICVKTLKVENNVLENGVLKLDYVIEIRGAKAERTKFELTVVDSEDKR